MTIIKRLSLFVLIVLLTLSLAGCTPSLIITFTPDELDVIVDVADVYKSVPGIEMSGFGVLEIKDLVIRLEIKGEEFDEEDIGELIGEIIGDFIGEIDDSNKVGEKTWEHVEEINQSIPILGDILSFLRGFLDADFAEIPEIEIDSTPWQGDDAKIAKILQIETAVLSLIIRDAESIPIESTSLTINFLSSAQDT